jgi:hypothetical protein
MEPEWVLSIRDQCRAAKVPFFFKQWGGVRKKQAGRSLAGKTYDQLPERGHVEVPSSRIRLALIEDFKPTYFLEAAS